jgi:subtilisin family serine protease
MMSEQATFPLPAAAAAEETTGRYIVTFQEGAVSEGIDVLRDVAGIAALPRADEFARSALDVEQLQAAGGAIFPTLSVAVVSMADDALNGVMTVAGENSSILSIEPERIYYAIGGLSSEYLRGYRDAVDNLYERSMTAGTEATRGPVTPSASDDASSTWGLKATRAINSRYTGRGINVAVLDTGLDLNHPDFRGRSITSKSFVPNQTVQDGQSHGTHCVGTACGFSDSNGRRYGVAYEANIYVGKVLGNDGSGEQGWIIAGMEWAIVNGCAVISMSLGNLVPTPSTAYETIGRRALQNNSLIVAAAGNHRQLVSRPPGTVGQPANSPSILAVAAVDSNLRLASFSCRSGTSGGANVDIAAPGVSVYASVPLPKRYDSYNGTSMATPHVAGLAALHAQATEARGARLWQILTSRSKRLSLPGMDAGSGLAQAP